MAITELARQFLPSDDIDKLLDEFLEYQHMGLDA
jgi:hypothetical protein